MTGSSIALEKLIWFGSREQRT